jgi:hypothetical protein
VDDRILSGVIEVEAVSQRTVRQDGVGGGNLDLRPDQGTLGRPPQTLAGANDRSAEVHGGGGEAAPDGVQGEEDRSREDSRGKILQREAGDKSGEASGDGGFFHGDLYHPTGTGSATAPLGSRNFMACPRVKAYLSSDPYILN